MRSLDAHIQKLILNKLETRAQHLLLEKVETRSQQPGDGRDAGIGIHNWIIQKILEFDYSLRESGVDCAHNVCLISASRP